MLFVSRAFLFSNVIKTLCDDPYLKIFSIQSAQQRNTRYSFYRINFIAYNYFYSTEKLCNYPRYGIANRIMKNTRRKEILNFNLCDMLSDGELYCRIFGLRAKIFIEKRNFCISFKPTPSRRPLRSTRNSFEHQVLKRIKPLFLLKTHTMHATQPYDYFARNASIIYACFKVIYYLYATNISNVFNCVNGIIVLVDSFTFYVTRHFLT